MMVYDHVVILRPENVVIDERARVDSFVKIEGGLGVVIGEYAHVASFCHVNIGGGEVVIGPHVGLASGARILGGSNRMVGARMSARMCRAGFSAARRWRIGKAKAAVLPVPVWAMPQRSRPWSAGGMAWT